MERHWRAENMLFKLDNVSYQGSRNSRGICNHIDRQFLESFDNRWFEKIAAKITNEIKQRADRTAGQTNYKGCGLELWHRKGENSVIIGRVKIVKLDSQDIDMDITIEAHPNGKLHQFVRASKINIKWNSWQGAFSNKTFTFEEEGTTIEIKVPSSSTGFKSMTSWVNLGCIRLEDLRVKKDGENVEPEQNSAYETQIHWLGKIFSPYTIFKAEVP